MTKSKTSGVHETYDYKMFKFLEDNRKLDERHIKKLEFSLQKFNDLHLHPIIVNNEMKIIDGQHRFEAAKNLLLPIYYMIDEEYEPYKMIDFNTTQKNWGNEDYLNYWTHHGNENYIKLNELRNDLGFPLISLLKWIYAYGNSIDGPVYKTFKRGNLKFKLSNELLEQLLSTKKIIDFLKSKNFKPEKIYGQTNFYTACRFFFRSPLVIVDQFFENLYHIPFNFRYCGTWQEYFEILAEIHNYKSRNKVKIISDGYKREIVK